MHALFDCFYIPIIGRCNKGRKSELIFIKELFDVAKACSSAEQRTRLLMSAKKVTSPIAELTKQAQRACEGNPLPVCASPYP
jgi:hypothetical protein